MGLPEGHNEGSLDGTVEGGKLGLHDGIVDGALVGTKEGEMLGWCDGFIIGEMDGETVLAGELGALVGILEDIGEAMGHAEITSGDREGTHVGANIGVEDG